MFLRNLPQAKSRSVSLGLGKRQALPHSDPRQPKELILSRCECSAYVERVSDWPPFARVPCWSGVVAQILSVPVVAQIVTYAR